MAMLALALAGLPGLSVDGRELERAGPSYTIDSLHEIRETMGPTASITFILGGDSVAQLHRWHRWREITSLVNLAILSRPGAPEVEDAEVLAWLKEHELATRSVAAARKRRCLLAGATPARRFLLATSRYDRSEKKRVISPAGSRNRVY